MNSYIFYYIIAKKKFSSSIYALKQKSIAIFFSLSSYPVSNKYLSLAVFFANIPSEFRVKNKYTATNQLLVGIPDDKRETSSSIWLRKHLFDYHLGRRNPILLAQLEQCADTINQYILTMDQNHPVILAPMHFVSDLVVGVMSSMVSPRRAIIISTHEDDALCENEDEVLRLLNISMKKSNPLHIKISELKSLIRSVKQRKENFIIYPDALPEVTYQLTQKNMKTFKCHLFKREAKLHYGIVELARMCDAQVLFYGIYYDKEKQKINVDIYGESSHQELEVNAPKFIEGAILKHPEDWMLWSSPSFFYFNAAG